MSILRSSSVIIHRENVLYQMNRKEVVLSFTTLHSRSVPLKISLLRENCVYNIIIQSQNNLIRKVNSSRSFLKLSIRLQG